MGILVLKTNIHDTFAKRRIQPVFDNHPEIRAWTVDIDDEDKVLRIEASDNLSYDEVIQMVSGQDLYCEELTN